MLIREKKVTVQSPPGTSIIKTVDASNLQQKPQSAERHKQVECNVCLRKMRSDNLKRHMLKHRELHTLDEGEMRDEIKLIKKLRETREEREQLVRQIADEEGRLPPEYCDIETSDTQDSNPVEEELLNDDQTYTRKIGRGKTICNILEQGSAREEQQGSAQTLQKESMRNPSNAELRGSNNYWIIYLLHLIVK